MKTCARHLGTKPWNLALALMLLLSVVLASLPTGSSAATTSGPTISLTPAFGGAGSTISISGSGYAPGDYRGTIRWDGADVSTFDIPKGGDFTISFRIPSAAAPGHHSITVCALSPCATGEFEQSASAAFHVVLLAQNLPLSVYRRAAQFIENVRLSGLAPEWDNAQLANEVQPLYRPDLKDIAYYEFAVQSPAPAAQSTRPSAEQFLPAGFLIVSAAEHDYPISHWSSSGLPPTHELQNTAQQAGHMASTFYKLDALAYAAEDAQGRLVATLGTKLTKVSGTDPSWLESEQQTSTAAWNPNQETKDDSNAGQISGTLESSGPTAPESLKLEEWASWDELKNGYAGAYGVLAEALRRQARQEWELDALAARYGEGLVKGQTYRLALLPALGPRVALSGEGAQYVQTATLMQAEAPSALAITVIDSVAGRDLPLDVTIDYADGRSETITFAIVGPQLVAHSVFLPLMAGGAPAQAPGQAQALQDIRPMSAWSAWSYAWAGTHEDQRLYDQIPPNSTPNTRSCYSGCGATAWAMLFGWADNQAARGNPAWAGRGGLYRVDGGYGADAVAPHLMDSGVREMTWEIVNRIGTFCFIESGATPPWSMASASGYLAGRSGTRLRTDYNVLGIHSDGLRDQAIASIVGRRTPAIIGTGWLSHYPLAYGYAWQSRTVRACGLFSCWDEVEHNRWFYVNQGWGGSGNTWVPASTWFVGAIQP